MRQELSTLPLKEVTPRHRLHGPWAKTDRVDDGAHNFRALGDKRHLFLSNRVSGTISIIDEQTLTKVGDITGLPPGPDDMEPQRHVTNSIPTLRHQLSYHLMRSLGLCPCCASG
ncbi:hypothetical protein ACH51_21555 (plasmid) [Ralstonia solanacearum]|nr:hypothetical protein ACH51_21555 [Ralstonia solanacearum]